MLYCTRTIASQNVNAVLLQTCSQFAEWTDEGVRTVVFKPVVTMKGAIYEPYFPATIAFRLCCQGYLISSHVGGRP